MVKMFIFQEHLPMIINEYPLNLSGSLTYNITAQNGLYNILWVTHRCAILLHNNRVCVIKLNCGETILMIVQFIVQREHRRFNMRGNILSVPVNISFGEYVDKRCILLFSSLLQSTTVKVQHPLHLWLFFATQSRYF